MQSERADKAMGIDHEDEVVLRSKELAIELAETRQLLWLAVKEAGQNPGRVTVRLTDLPADYEVETFKPDHSPGVVVIAATNTPRR